MCHERTPHTLHIPPGELQHCRPLKVGSSSLQSVPERREPRRQMKWGTCQRQQDISLPSAAPGWRRLAPSTRRHSCVRDLACVHGFSRVIASILSCVPKHVCLQLTPTEASDGGVAIMRFAAFPRDLPLDATGCHCIPWDTMRPAEHHGILGHLVGLPRGSHEF